MRSLGTRIADVQHHVPLEVLLNVQVPRLNVSQAVIGIDGKIVGHRWRCRRKTILQGQGCWSRGRVGFSESERRLESELSCHRPVLAKVVVDAVTGADNGFGKRLPGNAEARRKI